MPKKGKKGVDQRVKGNVKTASSGRMAELMGGEAGGFIGFEAVSGRLGGWEGVDGEGGRAVEEVPCGVGAEFQVVLKQLGKRDTTTKLKSLQEFSQLCRCEAQQSVVATLNLWSLMYNKLSMDNDNRVREASHKALRACAEKVKNAMGPHLRSLIGCWVAGMCDPHGPAASSAQAAFLAAFPPGKQKDVFKFGFKAILMHAEDIVLKQTPDTFSDPKVVPSDERVQRYERAVAMAVYGLGLTLQRLPSDFLERAEASAGDGNASGTGGAGGEGDTSISWEALLKEKRIWKLSRHSNPAIRAATFSLVATAYKQLPEFVGTQAGLLCPLVLGSLGESDPVVVGPLWEAILLTVTTSESWSEHVNVQKALLPGLWSLLVAGGNGSARVIYPCLLPLLSKLSEKVYATDVHFAKSFLERLRSGLQADRVRGSRSECEMVMQSFVECFLYLLLHTQPVEPEREAFHSHLLNMVVELVDFSISQCPASQCEVVYSTVVRLLRALLQAQPREPWLGPLLEELRRQVAEKVDRLVVGDQAGDRSKVNYSRLGDLLKCFQSQLRGRQSERQAVKFSVETSDKTESTDGERTEKLSAAGSGDIKAAVQFIQPALCAVCARCICEVCNSKSLRHSELLSTILGLYGDVSLVESVCSSLESEHGYLLKHEEHADTASSLLVLCSSLVRAAKLELEDSSESEEARFTESVIGCTVCLLYCGLAKAGAAVQFLRSLSEQHPAVLPLVLLKLNQASQREALGSLLPDCTSQLLLLLAGGEECSGGQLFLGRLLEVLLTQPSESCFAGLEIAGAVFTRACLLLVGAFRQTGSRDGGTAEATGESVERLLQVMSRVDSSLVKDFEDQVLDLLSCFLQCCLQWKDTGGWSLAAVTGCYSHLLSCLSEPGSHLQLVPGMISEQLKEKRADTQRCLGLAQMLTSLLRGVVDSAKSFWLVYKPLVSAAISAEGLFLPLAGLELFCRDSLYYSPSFKDIPSGSVLPSISHPFHLAIFPAMLLCDPKLLKGVPGRIPISPDLEPSSDTPEWSVDVKFPYFAEGEDSSEEAVAENWKLLVTALALGLSSLQPCQLRAQTDLEGRVHSILDSALQTTLSVGVGHSGWLPVVTSSIIDKVSAEGPVWSLVLHQLFVSLEGVTGPGREREEVIERLISVLFQEPEGGILHAALGGLSSKELYCRRLLALAQEREGDPCLVAACLSLLPDNDQLLSTAVRTLGSVVSQHTSSELSLFESVTESSSDPLTFSILELLSRLVQAKRVPPEHWDFVLCSLVTLTQLLTDAGQLSTVNQTVLYCRSLQLCCEVCTFLTSPFAQSQQSTEWVEFFQPALQENLLPCFLRDTSLTHLAPPTNTSCLAYQRYHLCRAICALSHSPDGSCLERLMSIVLSGFYPNQVAAFILGKRALGSLQIVLSRESDVPIPESKKIPISLPVLQDMFSASLEQVDLDLVFLEEDHAQSHTHHFAPHTTAYIFTWLLIIEAMNQCDPELRGAMAEWLKELALFDHLLHGLFKFLGETSVPGKKTDLEVTLAPNLRQLALVCYSAVARQLPSMLRQWYLSLDRQTSAMVNKLTVKQVSPALQQVELQAISSSNTTIGNMEVRVYAGASEVSVVYRLDEFSIELFVCLPSNYPLQPPAIREGKRVRVDPAQWRKWMLQLNVFVANQNGSLLDGLLLWKNNLDKHFAGVEDCMICFSVIHGSNHSLPKMVCRTCKKKFHSACLYKWFSTSTKSTCPLCRNIF